MDEGPIALVVRLIYRRYMPDHVNYPGEGVPSAARSPGLRIEPLEPVSAYAAAHSVRSITSRLMWG